MVLKVFAYLYTGSAAMLSEAIHSLADVLNQVSLIQTLGLIYVLFQYFNSIAFAGIWNLTIN